LYYYSSHFYCLPKPEIFFSFASLFYTTLLTSTPSIPFFNAPTNSFDKKDDFSELPPNQRRKKLQAKIEEITGKVSCFLLDTWP